jgi:hypothetical protein
VRCQKVKGKEHCTSKLVSGTFRLRGAAEATVSHDGIVFATGEGRNAHGEMRLRLTPLRRLRPGRYRLTLIIGKGKSEEIRTETLVLAGSKRHRMS